MLALGPIHEAVNGERLLVTKEFSKTKLSVLAIKSVILAHQATRRQRTALLRHSLNVAPEFDFFGQERVARTAVIAAFIRKADAIFLANSMAGLSC